MADHKVSLLDFLRTVRTDIEESRRLFLEEGKEAMFEIERVELEAQFTIGKEIEGKGGVQLYFVTLGGRRKYRNEEIQKIKLTFSAIGDRRAAGGSSNPPPELGEDQDDA